MKTIDLSKMTKEELEAYALETSEKLDEVSAELEYYRQLFRRSQVKQFGKKSEQTKVDDGSEQCSFFDETEAECDETVPEPKAEKACPIRRAKEKGRKDRNLKSLKKAEPVEYVLSEEERVCPACGDKLQVMSKRIHREIEIEPAKVKVREHIQYIYGCRNCEKNGTEAVIIAADMPRPLLRNSLVSPSLGAYIIARKYENRDPLEKISKDLKAQGVFLSKANLANWMMRLTEVYLQPLYERMKEHLLSYDIIQADETTLQVIKEERSTCYMWMFRSGNGRAPIVLYHYDQGSRSGAVAEAFLKGYEGYLQTDGYAGYNNAGEHVIRVGCLAHVRRYYLDALNGLSNKESPRAKKLKEGIEFCDKIFKLDAECHSIESAEERILFRRTRMQEAFEEFFAWAKKERDSLPPKGLYLTALNYQVNHEEALRNSLLDDRLEVSNNRAERAIKPFVMGRKNWLFCKTTRGAATSAVIYSLVVSATENGLLPFEYFSYLLDEVRKIDLTDKEAVDRLLPWSDTIPNECRKKEAE